MQGLVKVSPASLTLGTGTGSISSSGTVTISGASTVEMEDFITADYDRYLMLLHVTFSSATTLGWRTMDSGGDIGTATYDSQTLDANGTSLQAVGTANASYGRLGYVDSATYSGMAVMFSFNDADNPMSLSLNSCTVSSNPVISNYFTRHKVTVTATGIRLAGTTLTSITGKIRIYGFEQ